MNGFLYLVPIAIGMGALALAAFLWALTNGQYEDLEGAAQRVLFMPDDAPSCHREDERRNTT